jgi:hypothetical protein
MYKKTTVHINIHPIKDPIPCKALRNLGIKFKQLSNLPHMDTLCQKVQIWTDESTEVYKRIFHDIPWNSTEHDSAQAWQNPKINLKNTHLERRSQK